MRGGAGIMRWRREPVFLDLGDVDAERAFRTAVVRFVLSKRLGFCCGYAEGRDFVLSKHAAVAADGAAIVVKLVRRVYWHLAVPELGFWPLPYVFTAVGASEGTTA